MSLRDFRLLFGGSATSLLGDQLVLIATPWLVLQLTGDPLVLGIILALEGIPRAVFMLVGGAVTDRFSPRLVMFLADVIRLLLTGLTALVVLTGMVEIWMLYVFGLGFGLVAGFAIPAQNSIVPMLVEEQDLQAGNSIIMGITQLAGFVGPTIAGILIGGYSNSLVGIGLAFALDAVTFAVSAVCLWLIQGGSQHTPTEEVEKGSLWTSILTGMKNLWTDEALRTMFLVLAAVNFFLIGPLLIGIPVLADQRLPEGAVAFGLLMSASAGGNLVGYLMAGSLPRPGGMTMRLIMISVVAGFGLVVGLLGFIPFTWLDVILLFLLGLGNGYVAIILITWMQTHTPKEMIGRTMSLLTFSSAGLVPVSQAISGAVSKWSLDVLFLTAGTLALLVTFWMTLQPSFQTFSESLAIQEAGEGEPRIESVPSH